MSEVHSIQVLTERRLIEHNYTPLLNGFEINIQVTKDERESP